MQTTIALPGGEWFPSLLGQLVAAGVCNEPYGKSYVVDFNKLDIKGVIVRSKDVPRVVDSYDSLAVSGFTGTDILVESGARTLADVRQKNEWQVPTTPATPESRVYIGSTPPGEQAVEEQNAPCESPDSSLAIILGGTVATSYPNLLRQFIGEGNIESKKPIQPQIEKFDGKIEGLWRLLPNCLAICDIESSGETRKANWIRVFTEILQVSLVLYSSEEKMNGMDQRRLQFLQEALLEASTKESK